MSVVDRLRRIRRDASQLIVDVESWNDNRPDAPPMDCEAERVLVRLCDRGLAAHAAGDGKGLATVLEEIDAVARSEP